MSKKLDTKINYLINEVNMFLGTHPADKHTFTYIIETDNTDSKTKKYFLSKGYWMHEKFMSTKVTNNGRTKKGMYDFLKGMSAGIIFRNTKNNNWNGLNK